jgi:CDP-diacylglycerol--glycerol-3-phosphate 3-phosphatidyltransferase
MAELGKRTSVAVSNIGKLKTTAQMSAITILLYSGKIKDSLLGTGGLFLLYIAAFLTLWSMIVYLRAAWPLFFVSPDETKDIVSGTKN